MRKLFLTLFMLMLAATAQATTISLSSPGYNNALSVIIIPDGCEITSSVYAPPGNTATGSWTVFYSFQNGHGFTWGDVNDGSGGQIFFDAPVSNLVINWTTTYKFFAAASGEYFRSPCPQIFCFGGQGIYDFETPSITTLQWDSYHTGYGGVEIMSFDAPQQVSVQQSAIQHVPEPSTLALLPLGLAGLWMARRRRA